MGLYIHVLLTEANNHGGVGPEMIEMGIYHGLPIYQLFYAILILTYFDQWFMWFLFRLSAPAVFFPHLITGIVAWACRRVTATSGPRARPWKWFWRWAHNTTLIVFSYPIFLQ